MNHPRILTFAALFLCILSTGAFAQATPTDVYNRLLGVAAEVDLVRAEMGIDVPKRPDFVVSGARPREVYFQAITLFEKSNRLLFEQLRERDDRPEPPKIGDVTPNDVLLLVNHSLSHIRKVKEALGIHEQVAASPVGENRTPSDVFTLIVRVNRVLNAMLKQRFAPAEVFQQLTYGVGLAAGVLASTTDSDRLGIEPEFVRRKTPLDVYRKLIEVYEIIYDTMELSGRKGLRIDAAEMQRSTATPSDVYDLASLIVAELSYLHSVTPGASPPRDSYYPGDKLPSHVYQRVGRLESQMLSLRQYVSDHPNWLAAR